MDRITRFSEIKEDVDNDNPSTQNIEFSYLVSDFHTDDDHVIGNDIMDTRFKIFTKENTNK